MSTYLGGRGELEGECGQVHGPRVSLSEMAETTMLFLFIQLYIFIYIFIYLYLWRCIY